MGDLAPYFSGLVSVIVSYVAMRVTTERRFAQIEAKQAAHEERIAQALDEARVGRELTVQIAALASKVDDLRSDVAKHNNLIERTYKLESDTATAFHRIDELRDVVHDIKIGGTS